jgi:hypothetical protein
MDMHENERPSIHVALLKGSDAALYHWVQIGAEEEGVPCRLIDAAERDMAALAYAAALSSRFGIGVGVSHQAVVLHERRMPPAMPVLSLTYSGQADYFCRLIGTNAARMIIRKPLRFAEDEADQRRNPVKAHPSWTESVEERPLPTLPDDPALIAKIVLLVLQKLREHEA